jgi:hypothetical protein
LEGLYDLSDPKAFIEEAAKEIGPSKPGLARLAWIVYGPEVTKPNRLRAMAAMLRSGDTEAVALFRRLMSDFPSEQFKDLVELVKDNANGSLFSLLGLYGTRVFRWAPKEVMEAIQAYEAAGGTPKKEWIAGVYPLTTAMNLEKEKTPEAIEAAVWLLKQAGPVLLEDLGNQAALYLKSKKLDLASFGVDADARAAHLDKRATHLKHYWTDEYYASYRSYQVMPEEMLLCMRAPGSSEEHMVYDDAALEAFRSLLLNSKWMWSLPLLERFIERAVGLPPAWAEKIRDVFTKPATEQVKA